MLGWIGNACHGYRVRGGGFALHQNHILTRIYGAVQRPFLGPRGAMGGNWALQV